METKLKKRWDASVERVNDILEDVKVLLNYSEEDLQILQSYSTTLQSWADEIIEEFYKVLLKDDRAKRIIEENNIDLNRLKAANKRWYLQIVSGEIDENFFLYSFFVGLVHIRYGVDNHLMIFMADVLRRKFLELALKNFDKEEAFKIYQSFSKIVAAFVGMTVEGYIFMLQKAFLDILGMKPELVQRLLTMELEQTLKSFRKQLGR